MKKEYIISIAIVATMVIGFLVYDNYQKSARITDLQTQTYNRNASDLQKQIINESDKNQRDALKAETEQRNLNYRNNIFDFLKVKQNSYLSNQNLGGISDLTFDIKNLTAETIEDVQLEIDYVQANGKIYKTEYVQSGKLKSQQLVKISAPDSERGTAINYRIHKVYAPSFNLCYPGDPMDSHNESDPYYCQ